MSYHSYSQVRGTRAAAALLAIFLLSSAAWGQIRVEKTVHANRAIPQNGTIWSELWWADSGLSEITSASLTVSLSSPFETNPMKLNDLTGYLYFGLDNENYREFELSLGSFTSAVQTFNLGTAFNGDWLASNFWELELSDTRGGGVAQLDRWTLSLTGTMLQSGTIDPGAGGVISASGEEGAELQTTLQTSGTGADAVRVQSEAGQAIVVSSGLTGAGDIRKEGAGVLQLAGTSTNFTGRVVVDSGEVVIASSGALGASGRLEVAGANTTVRLGNAVVLSNQITVTEGASARLEGAGRIEGAITGSGGIVKDGAETMTLAGTNTFTGATVVRQGRLILDSTARLAADSTVTVTNATLTVNGVVEGTTTVSDGGVIGGSGTVGTLVMSGGGTLAPGNSAGTVTATNGATWSQNGFYDWEIFDLAGPAGTGWDLLDVTGGTLDLTGITTAGGYTINLITLQSDNLTPGALTGFDANQNYSNWLIAQAPEIVGFDPTRFTLNSSGFVGATGTFGITLMAIEGGEGIFLTYSAPEAFGGEVIPEPGTWAAAILLALAAGYVQWRRRKVSA